MAAPPSNNNGSSSSNGNNNSALPTTAAEREAELIALQSAFDEYIASSRELEEELDAELARMRKFSLVQFYCSSAAAAAVRVFGSVFGFSGCP